MSTAVYDKIGKTYDLTRQADPDILARILHHLHPNPQDVYLDVGCGTGNYTNALYKNGVNICGLDISTEMLSKARKKNAEITWVLGDARELPFPDQMFGGATCTLATHHIKDIQTAFREVYRVIDSGAFVILAILPEQVEALWLKVYFPSMINQSIGILSSFDTVSQALRDAGFKNISYEKFSMSKDTRDLFLAAGKNKPELYLDPHVRAGISSFALCQNQQELETGLECLRNDIDSGKIHEIIKALESDLGDYVFVVSHKSN